MNLEIRVAQSNEERSIFELLQACGKHLADAGVDQWDSNYPPLSRVQEDLANQSLFCGLDDGALVAVITLNNLESPEYVHVDWQFKGTVLAVHRLAVTPEYQGKGIARKLMDFAEEHAASIPVDTIRLDTFSGNARNVRFYKNRGYLQCGEVHFRGLEASFVCFEKAIT